MNRWRVLQLADSAFPSGAFAHSAGIEAAMRCGEIANRAELDALVDGAVWQAGRGALPFVSAAFDALEHLSELDRACDATLVSHVANRASRSQGRALVSTCARVFDAPSIVAMAEACRARTLRFHLAPAFGAVMHALGVERRETLEMNLYGALRCAVSASVRLGLVGPHEAQRMIDARTDLLERVLARCADIPVEGAAQARPLLDLLGARQDTLDVKMFVS